MWNVCFIETGRKLFSIKLYMVKNANFIEKTNVPQTQTYASCCERSPDEINWPTRILFKLIPHVLWNSHQHVSTDRGQFVEIINQPRYRTWNNLLQLIRLLIACMWYDVVLKQHCCFVAEILRNESSLISIFFYCNGKLLAEFSLLFNSKVNYWNIKKTCDVLVFL